MKTYKNEFIKDLRIENRFWALGAALMLLLAYSSQSVAGEKCTRGLKFQPDQTFKIVQFTDTQDDDDIDTRTVQLIEAVLDAQKPNLVVFTGDNITSGCDTPEEVRTAINHLAEPVDSRKIPWFITFGNHDEDSTPNSGLDEEDMLDIYRSYDWNINKPSREDVHGTGNFNVVVKSAQGYQTAFNIWGLDSGRYAPRKIAGQSIADDTRLPEWDNRLPHWDWIRPSQIRWYTKTHACPLKPELVDITKK